MDKEEVLSTISLWIKEKKWKSGSKTPLLQLPDVWESLQPSIAHFAGHFTNLLPVPAPSHAMSRMQESDSHQDRGNPELSTSLLKEETPENWTSFSTNHSFSQCPAIVLNPFEGSSTHKMTEDDLQRAIQIIQHPDKLIQESHQRFSLGNDSNKDPLGLHSVLPTSASWNSCVRPPFPEIQVSNPEELGGSQMVALSEDDRECFPPDDASIANSGAT